MGAVCHQQSIAFLSCFCKRYCLQEGRWHSCGLMAA